MRVQLTGMLTGFLLSACTPAEEGRPVVAEDAAEREAVVPVPTPTADSAAVAALVYVPVYSHIYYRDERRVINLAATLSIRNTDPEHPITIATVRYYDSAGKLVRGYLREPVLLLRWRRSTSWSRRTTPAEGRARTSWWGGVRTGV